MGLYSEWEKKSIFICSKTHVLNQTILDALEMLEATVSSLPFKCPYASFLTLG